MNFGDIYKNVIKIQKILEYCASRTKHLVEEDFDLKIVYFNKYYILTMSQNVVSNIFFLYI